MTRKTRLIFIGSIVGALVALIGPLCGQTREGEGHTREELRRVVMATWRGPHISCMLPPPIELRPTVDGRIAVTGRAKGRVQAMRQIQERPFVFVPVIEDMTWEALRSRRLVELRGLAYCLVSVPRVPRAQAAAARLYLGLHTLVTRELPWELLESDDPELWAARCGIRIYDKSPKSRRRDPKDWSHYRIAAHLFSWKPKDLRGWFLFQYELLDWRVLWSVLTPLKFRSQRVWQAQIENLREMPSWVKLLPEEKQDVASIAERMGGRCPEPMSAALRYLVRVYRDDRKTRDALVDLCRDPEAAIGVFDGCKDELARAIFALSKSK